MFENQLKGLPAEEHAVIIGCPAELADESSRMMAKTAGKKTKLQIAWAHEFGYSPDIDKRLDNEVMQEDKQKVRTPRCLRALGGGCGDAPARVCCWVAAELCGRWAGLSARLSRHYA